MHDLLIAGSDRCYRQPTNSSWSESAVERTLSSISAILMNDPALCCLVERRRNPGKLRFRLIEFPRGDRLANLLLARFERTGDAGVACAASDALARAFGCGFDVCHEVKFEVVGAKVEEDSSLLQVPEEGFEPPTKGL